MRARARHRPDGRRRRHRRGREGRGADALQRRAHRRRLAARGRHRRRPARGHDADARRACRTRWRSSRCPSAARCSTRARASTWRRWPAAPRSPTCSTSTGRSARRSGSSPSARASTSRDVMVVVLDRPRHEDGIKAIRDAGARVRLISDGDVSAAMLAVSDNSPVDLLWGVGGTPEGVISAAALKCMGGELVGRLWPRDDEERQAALDAGYDLERQLTADDLVALRRLLLLRHRRHRRRRPAGRPLPGRARRGDDRVAGHALALGHRAPRRRPATTARSCARSPARGTASRDAWRPVALRRSRARDRVRQLVDRPRSARPRLGEVEPGERAQEAVGDEHVDARLRVLVDPAADRRARSPDRSSRPRPRRGAIAEPGVVARRRGAGRRSRGSRCRRGPAARRGCPCSMRQRTMPRSPSISYSGAWKVSSGMSAEQP